MENFQNNQQLKAAKLEQRMLPFSDSPTAKQLMESLSEGERELAEEFILTLGAKKADAFLQSMTPEKLSLMLEIGEERRNAKLAIARWNYIAKSIKYSYISLILTVSAGYLVAHVLLDTAYSPFDVLQRQVGMRFMKRWFLALFLGSVHNVYDSIMLQKAIKKVREFGEKWLSKIRSKKGA